MTSSRSSGSRPRPPAKRLRRLSRGESVAYDVLPADLAARVRLVHPPRFPGRFSGITLGRYVVLEHGAVPDGGNSLLAHELVHVRQWAELGVVGFLTRYLVGFGAGLVRHRRWHRAYLDIPLEREARAGAEAWKTRRAGTAGPGRAGR